MHCSLILKWHLNDILNTYLSYISYYLTILLILAPLVTDPLSSVRTYIDENWFLMQSQFEQDNSEAEAGNF